MSSPGEIVVAIQLMQLPEGEEESTSSGAVNRLVERAMDAIRPEFRERTWKAFCLATLDGRSSTEVAEELGISAHAARKAKSRVLGRLRDELAGAD